MARDEQSNDLNDRIKALRREIIARIVATMKEHGLREVRLNTDDDTPEGQADPVYVLWVDDNGNWYEAPVKRVTMDGEYIRLHCEDDNDGDVTIESHEFACRNLYWLEEIRQAITKTLGL